MRRKNYNIYLKKIHFRRDFKFLIKFDFFFTKSTTSFKSIFLLNEKFFFAKKKSKLIWCRSTFNFFCSMITKRRKLRTIFANIAFWFSKRIVCFLFHCHDTNFDNTHITHVISHALSSIIDSQTLTTRKLAFSLILKYKTQNL